MIPVVITIIGIVLYKVYIRNKINYNKIRELETRLEQYYKERENRLKSKGAIRRGTEWPE
jgi:hypothetical protein